MSAIKLDEIKYDAADQKVFEVGINGRTIYLVGITYAEIEEKCNTEYGGMPYFISIKGKLMQ